MILLALLSFRAGDASNRADDIIGFWWIPHNTAKIQMYKVGSRYYGKLYWIKDPNQANGQPKLDSKNPDPKQRNKVLTGLEIVKGLKYAGNNHWIDGTVYDPESGSSYSCKMTLQDYNTLEVRGYLGFSVFGRTEIFRRAN